MNLRGKFIWDVLIAVSIMAFLYTGYQLYNLNVERTAFNSTFEKELVGTDKDLRSKIAILEKQLNKRSQYNFKITKEPTELTAVVYLDGEGFKYYGVSSIIVTAIVSGERLEAVVSHKDEIYHVEEGDEVAGGVITSITPTEVIFSKNGINHVFSVLPSIN